MITVREQKDVYSINVKVRKPAIHLDHWTLRRLSSDENLKFIFLSFFRSKGTLFFSWANVFDLINQDKGQSMDRIKMFLSEIGDQWALIRMNPGDVIRAEENPELYSNPPWFDENFLKMYYPTIHGRSLSLSHMIDLVNQTREVLKKHQLEHQIEMSRIIDEAKKEFSASSSILQRYKKLALEALKAKRYCRAAFRGFLWSIFSRTDHFDGNDVTDFYHSVVNLAYADIIFLDKHWKNLAMTMPGCKANVRVYKESELMDFFKFLKSQFSYREKRLVKEAYKKILGPNYEDE